MTYREAFNAVRVMSYDQTVIARKASTDRVFRRVCRWRLTKGAEYREILLLVCRQGQDLSRLGAAHTTYGKRKATIGEIRERARRDGL